MAVSSDLARPDEVCLEGNAAHQSVPQECAERQREKKNGRFSVMKCLERKLEETCSNLGLEHDLLCQAIHSFLQLMTVGSTSWCHKSQPCPTGPSTLTKMKIFGQQESQRHCTRRDKPHFQVIF